MFGNKVKIWKPYTGYVDAYTETQKIEIKYVNKSPHKNPIYEHEGDSGFDARAWITEEDAGAKLDKESSCMTITLKPLERRKIHTGIYFELPDFTEIQCRSRSGRSLEDGLVVVNSPATIDEKYRGEACVLIINLSNNKLTIKDGEKIGQFVLCPVYNSRLTKLTEVEEIANNTDRGEDGFGSTGKE